MAQAAVTENRVSPRPAVPVPLEQGLRRLRHRLRAHLVVAGLGPLLAVLLGLTALSFALDYTFRLDLAQRGVLLFLFALVLLGRAWRRLVQPLATAASDEALCLAVERHHPELRQTLIAALQLVKLDDLQARGYSPQLVAAAVGEGEKAARAIDFLDVLDFRRFAGQQFRLTVVAVLCGALVGGIFSTATLALWFQRNVLLSSTPWPQSTYFALTGVVGNRLVVPRGDDWRLVVKVTPESRVDPEMAYLEFAGPRAAEPLRKLGRRRFEAEFTDVASPFRFRVRGGDALTEWIEVELVDRPALESLQVTVHWPAYTGRAPSVFVPQTDPLTVLRGSRLEISGQSNKRLAQARLATADRAWRLSLVGDQEITGALEAADLADATYAVRLVDCEEPVPLASNDAPAFALRVASDRVPKVRAEKFGVGPLVLPRARAGISGEAHDDFTLAALEWRYELRSGDGQRLAAGNRRLESAVPANQGGLAFREFVELSPLAAQAGQTLVLRVAATDYNAVTGPQTGESLEIPLQVASEEELRADLLRREKELRQEFEHQVKLSEDLLTDTKALRAGVLEVSPLPADQRPPLLGLQQRHKQIAANCLSIAERFTRIAHEVENNRVEAPDGPLLTRLRDLILVPFAQLSNELLPAARVPLETARRQADEAAPRDQALAQAITLQEAQVAKMRDILRYMEKSEGYQEAVNLLYAIQNSQQDVYNSTQRELRARIQALLEGNKSSSPNTP